MRRAAIAVMLGLGLAMLLMHPLWRAEWAVMDDYVTLAQLGVGGSLPWRDVPAVIAGTEAGHPGATGRYRPALWMLRTVEAAVLGPSPTRWFVWRTMQFGFVMAVVWWIVSAYTGGLVAVLLTVYAASHYYWRDTFVHLFVSENWAAVFVALFAVGAERSWRAWTQGRAIPAAWLVTMALAGAFAGACKENLLILLPLYAGALYFAVRRSPVRPAVWLSSALYGATGLAITVAVLVGLRHTGGIDLYGNPVSASERIALLARPLPIALVCAWGILVAMRRWARRLGSARLDAARNLEWQTAVRHVIVVAAVSTAVLLSQFVFYNGDWPTGGSRFDFPGRLVEVVAYVTLWHFGQRAAVVWGISPRSRRTAEGLFAFCVMLLIARHPLALQEGAIAQAALTHRVGAARRAIADSVRGTRERPIVLVATNEADLEAVSAMAVGLRVVERVPNPIFLDAAQVTLATGPTAGRDLPELADISRFGGAGLAGRLAPPIHPWREFEAAPRTQRAAPVCLRLRNYDAPVSIDCPPRLR